jgi:DNA-binding transcriptional ArsR family regulator
MRRDPFQAIADPTRRKIITLLAAETMNLNAIAEHFKMSRPAVSQHIKLLTECGLIIIRQEGRERYCEPKLDQLNMVADWVNQSRKIWLQRFGKLENVLREMNKNDHSSTKKISHAKRK